MVKVKGLDVIKANYLAAAGTIPQKYTAGVQNSKPWQAGAIASEALYEAKIQAAIANQSRVKGIQKVTDAAWQHAALNKGASRIGEGVRQGADKHSAKFAPYKAALESVTLPAKTADAVSNVTNRVIPIVQALVAAKKAQT